MSIVELREEAASKTNFESLERFYRFTETYLELIAGGALQAQIVSQNEDRYRFFQYGYEANYSVTRPINSELFLFADDFERALSSFNEIFRSLADGVVPDEQLRPVVGSFIYTVQQSIGAALDALPAGRSNTARKVNGDLFERFICMLISSLGIECHSGILRVPVFDQTGVELFKMNYQHDLMVAVEGELKVIGSVKTSSKDRIDKVFMDKFLYGRLTSTDLPHIAIFLNDVQRKGREPNYGVNGTFLSGHFKAYTLKLNPLDGIYYCDIRPNMLTDGFLSDRISTIDKLFFDDLPRFLLEPGRPLAATEIIDEDDFTE
jgi:hypothetical protein